VEKERRLQEWLVNEARCQQKTLNSDVVHYLMQHLGPDLATLDQELAKLICFVGDKPRIELDDAKAICGTRDLFTAGSWLKNRLGTCDVSGRETL